MHHGSHGGGDALFLCCFAKNGVFCFEFAFGSVIFALQKRYKPINFQTLWLFSSRMANTASRNRSDRAVSAQLRKCQVVMERHATLWLSRWCGFLVMTPVVAMADVWSMVAIVWVSECAVEHGGITAKRFSCP